MDEKSKILALDLIDAIEDVDTDIDISVTKFEITEFSSDPTDDNSQASGVEISLGCYGSYDVDETNPYRVN